MGSRGVPDNNRNPSERGMDASGGISHFTGGICYGAGIRAEKRKRTIAGANTETQKTPLFGGVFYFQ